MSFPIFSSSDASFGTISAIRSLLSNLNTFLLERVDQTLHYLINLLIGKRLLIVPQGKGQGIRLGSRRKLPFVVLARDILIKYTNFLQNLPFGFQCDFFQALKTGFLPDQQGKIASYGRETGNLPVPDAVILPQ